MEPTFFFNLDVTITLNILSDEALLQVGTEHNVITQHEEKSLKLLDGKFKGNIRNISFKWINRTPVSEAQLLQRITHVKLNQSLLVNSKK